MNEVGVTLLCSVSHIRYDVKDKIYWCANCKGTFEFLSTPFHFLDTVTALGHVEDKKGVLTWQEYLL